MHFLFFYFFTILLASVFFVLDWKFWTLTAKMRVLEVGCSLNYLLQTETFLEDLTWRINQLCCIEVVM